MNASVVVSGPEVEMVSCSWTSEPEGKESPKMPEAPNWTTVLVVALTAAKGWEVIAIPATVAVSNATRPWADVPVRESP